jgi:hypothetical protein
MGTRLYPRTKRPKTLEILAEVPARTYEKLEEFKSEPENQYNPEDTKKRREVWERKQKRKSLNKLDDFLLYGWGGLNKPAIKVLERWGLNARIGETRNPVVVRALVNSMGIDLKEIELDSLEGLKWG